MEFKQEDIYKLIDRLENSNVAYVKIQTPGGLKIEVGKKPHFVGAPHLSHNNPAFVPHAVNDSANVSTSDNTQKAREIMPDSKIMRAPLVGTFYAASSPGQPPFVKAGDKVSKGDVLCIIEAMKIMNEIEIEFDGVIEKVLVKSGEPIEFNQPLFEIR